MKSTAVKKRKEARKGKENNVLTTDEKDAYILWIERMQRAKQQRDQNYPEFDDLTYEQDYELNMKIANSYLRRKNNPDEVKVNMGIAEKKLEAIINEIIKANYTPEIIAYTDEDVEIAELGQNTADLVKRTEEMENFEDMQLDMLQELMSQRAVFVEEIWDVKETTKKKKISGELGKQNFQFEEKDRIIEMPRKKMLSGLQVYLGDITIPASEFDSQPYVIIYARCLYEEAERTFGNWKQWKYVKPGMGVASWYGGTFKYRFSQLIGEEVEILYCKDPHNDEYQIIINGVPMLHPSHPCPWEHIGYDMTMVVPKPSANRNFAYGKPPIASAKSIQWLSEESLRLLVRKFRQATDPPMGVPSGKIYSRDIWNPSARTQGIKKDDMVPLIYHQGVTTSDLEMMNLFRSIESEFIGTPDTMQGISGKKKTATQHMQEQQAAIQMVGHSTLAWMRLLKHMYVLRIYNIFENGSKPIGRKKNPLTNKIEDVFRKFTVKNGNYPDGNTGKKIIQFMNRPTTPQEEQDITDYTDQQEALGKPLKIRTINVEALIQLNVHWHIVVNTRDKDGSSLAKVMFRDALEQAQEVSQVAQRPLNGDKIIEDYGRTWNKKDYFMPKENPALAGMGGQSSQDQGQGGDQGGGDGSEQNKDQAKDLASKIDAVAKGGTTASMGSSGVGGQMKQGQAKKPAQTSIKNMATQPA